MPFGKNPLLAFRLRYLHGRASIKQSRVMTVPNFDLQIECLWHSFASVAVWYNVGAYTQSKRNITFVISFVFLLVYLG